MVQRKRSQRDGKISGQLTTQDIQDQMEFLVWREQRSVKNCERFKSNKERLNLPKNEKGIFICEGRIEEDYPLYLPKRSLLTDKIVEHCHLGTLHWGLSITMTEVYVPKLKQRVKSIRYRCHRYKRFHVRALRPHAHCTSVTSVPEQKVLRFSLPSTLFCAVLNTFCSSYRNTICTCQKSVTTLVLYRFTSCTGAV